METQTRWRPNIRPLNTERGPPSPPGLYSSRSSIYSASMRSPNMLSPMYPSSPGYDQAMRRHERAMLESLDQRGRSGQAGQPSQLESQNLQSVAQNRSLFPIAEQNLRRASLASPPPRPSASSPRSPGRLMHRPRQTLAAETRSILLSGIPDPQTLAERRQSLPPSFPVGRRGSRHVRQELQAWGHVYFGNGSEASCFVAAVALRRPSEASSGDDGPTRSREHRRVTIRARVRPRALDRKPFLLQRTFDMDELRATVPEPSPTAASPRQLSADLGSRDAQLRARRRSSTSDPADPSAELNKSPVRSTNTVPIHLRYARAYFPVLAALIYSGHIQARDIIDLPLPHPEAWTQTAAHVYTGQGELTDAVRQNIEYLGGKV
ncbi:hypothetical protein B0T26DRAFT_82054 [Lasiosphaeria miniovina]|uniref:Uncharacterized protein n=1 Tax=Lasiosphaeria miniovina TaxID=1954250 RepID=A0AA40ECD3_9PEZI|nr:uncharacterized protein B0T26DRAFT_82054 [Lasiosphaeria miniovina]KAK0734810.1 hypothetical protein B0T26DRAFT_82054 [Lasiosphaeria miniovina]